MSIVRKMSTVYSYHATYEFKNESLLYKFLIVKEFLLEAGAKS